MKQRRDHLEDLNQPRHQDNELVYHLQVELEECAVACDPTHVRFSAIYVMFQIPHCLLQLQFSVVGEDNEQSPWRWCIRVAYIIQMDLLLGNERRCVFCRSFNYDLLKTTGFLHHPNWQELEVCAERGCDICAFARDAARPEEDYKNKEAWRKAKLTEQIVCTLFEKGSLAWTCGKYYHARVPICVAYDDPLAILIPTRPVFDSILSDGCVSMMKGWLKKCSKEHQICEADTTHELPTRVVKVGSDHEDPRLVISQGRQGRWIALSHCWGQDLPIKTERSNLELHCEVIRLSSMGPTFEDAVLITRALGVEYIWIDALCIIQDDTQDWERESRTMDYVYQRATVTIAAEASPSSHVGIRGSMQHPRDTGKYLRGVSCYSTKHGLEGRLLLRSDKERMGSRGPLSSRGWAMQEEVLSPRVLRFSRQQVLWRCNADAKWSEWQPEAASNIQADFADSLTYVTRYFPKSSQNNETIYSERQRNSLFDSWYRSIANVYAGRRVTFASDRLVAIAGIAKAMRKYLPDSDFEAGLWTGDIHRGLVWTSPASGVTSYPDHIAPSWSWTHLDFSTTGHSITPLYGPIIERVWFRPASDILGFEDLTLKGNSLHLAARAIKIRAAGRSICSCRTRNAFLDQRHTLAGEDEMYSFSHMSVQPGLCIEYAGLDVIGKPCGRHKTYLYLQIARWDMDMERAAAVDDGHVFLIALILDKVGTISDCVFRRIGRALIPSKSSRSLDWSEMTVKIV